MLSVSSNRMSFVLLLLSTVWLSGCLGAPRSEILPSAADRLVAKDFAQIVGQVERYSLETTTFRVPKPIGPVDPFSFALREELVIAGYNIEYLSFNADINDPVVSHQLERTILDDGEMRTYTVSLSGVSFRRGYIIDGEGQVRPITTMQAKGIESEVLRQDDTLFGADVNVASNAAGLNQAVLSADVTAQTVPDPIGEELIVIPPLVDASVASNENNSLQGMQIVDESLLVFRGESLVLGEANKRRVVGVVENYNSGSDVFSLLGCVRSEDLDWTEEANELVRGRTERVRSELRYAGIPNERIRTEDCTREVGVAAPNLPPGSVLLLLNRSEP